MAEPKIAGCSGGFDVPGVTTNNSKQLQCQRNAGNDSNNPNGKKCSVEDLCADGWHVCTDMNDVKSHASMGQCDDSSPDPVFWLTRQVEDMPGMCVVPPNGNANNIAGCGQGIADPITPQQACDPLSASLRAPNCQASQTWSCGMQQGNNPVLNEGDIVTHSGAAEGGVLCCKN
jgi:hypothetical protein